MCSTVIVLSMSMNYTSVMVCCAVTPPTLLGAILGPRQTSHTFCSAGPIVRLGPNEVDVCDIKAYKEIYTVRETFVKSYWYKILTGGFVDTIFTTSDTTFHRRIRRLLSAPLSEASLASSHDFIAIKVNLAIQRMKEEMAEKGAADVYKWWLFMATDIIGELTFGKSFEMLDKTEVRIF